MPELVTAYALAYQNWTVVPHHIDADFGEMVDCGFGAVALSFSESEMRYGRRTFQMQVRMARRRGLKVLVVPSRIGGRFAGAPLMPSLFLMAHPECVESGKPGNLGPMACLLSTAFVDFCHEFMGTLLRENELDGIIWDEPKGTAHLSEHPDAVKRFGGKQTEPQRDAAFAEFLGGLNGFCRGMQPGLIITLFVQDSDPASFTQAAAKAKGLDYFGYDGNLAPQSHQLGEARWHKYRIEKPWRRCCDEAAAAGVKRFALVENMLMPASSHGEYERNLDAYLQGELPEHLAVYYYGHENEDPVGLHAITRRLMRRRLRR